MEQYKQEFIEFMVESQVLKFGDFTLKSGRKSPFFMNAGAYVNGSQLRRLGEYYARAIHDHYGLDFDVLFGPAYKGIPLVAATAASLATDFGLDKPYFFNRKEVKDHGEGGGLVGYPPKDGDRILIIEDVITAGTAVRETMPILQGCGKVTVPAMFISVNRCEVGQNPGKTAVMEVREEFGIQVHSLVTVQDIYEFLKGQAEYRDMLPRMEAYMQQYCVFE